MSAEPSQDELDLAAAADALGAWLEDAIGLELRGSYNLSGCVERVLAASGCERVRAERDALRDDRDRLSAKLQAQIAYTKIEYGSCGGLDWTIQLWGRITHKHACLDRPDAWCQTHPEGCPSEEK